MVGHIPDCCGENFTLRHLKCINAHGHGGAWLIAFDTSNGRGEFTTTENWKKMDVSPCQWIRLQAVIKGKIFDLTGDPVTC